MKNITLKFGDHIVGTPISSTAGRKTIEYVPFFLIDDDWGGDRTPHLKLPRWRAYHSVQLDGWSIEYVPTQHSADQSIVPSRANRTTPSFKQRNLASVLSKVHKIGKKADTYAQGVVEHVKLGPKISETVKGKLSLGARIIKVGGVGKIYRRLFHVSEGEKLLKCCQCYLSTTAGPIAGLIFISNKNVAFRSERSIEFSSSDGKLHRYPYKVFIPLGDIKRIDQSQHAQNSSRKYIEMVTVDNFDFWFMGFFNCDKALKCLRKALFQYVEKSSAILAC